MDLATITHKITLSMTDFNLVGDIKVRQADDETQVFDAVILEHGMIKNFEGLKPFFCLMAREITGQGVSEEPVTVYDGTKGTLKYTLSANAMQMVGRNEAYFSFRKELTNGAWAEQFSTRSFYYTVEKSIYTQPFKDSNYWFTFKELYRQFNDYIESGKISWEDFIDSESQQWKDFLEHNKEILESIDPGGAILSELIRSRKPAEYTTSYIDLPTRLDEQIGKNSDFREFETGVSFMKRVFNENRERAVNVKWFGALGDGVNDDTSAINSAVNYAIENGSNSIYFPETSNYYNVQGTINLNNINGFRLFGAGIDMSSIRNKTQDNVALLKIIGSENIYVENLSFQNGVLKTDGTHDGLEKNAITIENSSDIKLSNLKIEYCSGFSGILIRKSSSIEMSSIRTFSNAYRHVSLQEETSDISLINSVLDTTTLKDLDHTYLFCTGGTDFTSEYDFLSRNIYIDNCKFLNNPKWEGIDSHGVSNMTVTNCYVENVKVGIMIGYDDRVNAPYEFDNITVSNNIVKRGNGEADGNGIVIKGGTQESKGFGENIYITNNKVSGGFGNKNSTYTASIYLTWLKNIYVSGNNVEGSINLAFAAIYCFQGSIESNIFLNTEPNANNVIMPVRFLNGCYLIEFTNNLIRNNGRIVDRGVYSTEKGLVNYDKNFIIATTPYQVYNAMMNGALNSSRIGFSGIKVKNQQEIPIKYCTDTTIKSLSKQLSMKCTGESGGNKLIFDKVILEELCLGESFKIVANNQEVVLVDLLNAYEARISPSLNANVTNSSVETLESTWEDV